MNKFIYPCIYAGVQIHKVIIAKSKIQASKTFGISLHLLNSYASICDLKKSEKIIGIMGYMDSGRIVFTEGRKDLWCKLMPIHELEKIIDESNKNFYGRLYL